jgi:hypothetical protein
MLISSRKKLFWRAVTAAAIVIRPIGRLAKLAIVVSQFDPSNFAPDTRMMTFQPLGVDLQINCFLMV